MLLKLHDTCSADAVIDFHMDNIKMSSACPASACKTGNKAGAPAPLIQRGLITASVKESRAP